MFFEFFRKGQKKNKRNMFEYKLKTIYKCLFYALTRGPQALTVI